MSADLVLGVAGVLGGLKGALDAYLLIDAVFDDLKTDTWYAAIRYQFELTRVHYFCREYDLSTSKLQQKPQDFLNLIKNTAEAIAYLFKASQKFIERHEIGLSEPDSQLHGFVKAKSRVRWVIKEKAEFEDLLVKIERLVDNLFSLTDGTLELQSLKRALPSLSLRNITDDQSLRILQDPEFKFDTTLRVSANVKLVRKQLEQSQQQSGTVFTGNEITMLPNSTSLGSLRSRTVLRSVWIEWSVINNDGSDGADRYVRRIKALGCLLEKVSHVALCLPACYGIFDDLEYQYDHGGARRVGYVFGLPCGDQSTPLASYDDNFRNCPPRTLTSLVESKEFPAPLLGDRFRLALGLATAFSHFHVAGWLHKGFHSSNIIFFTKVSSSSGPTVDVTDPFITGFQYSRPATVQSLSRGPLETSGLEHYYHPSAAHGFTRSTDLYSLGVVLCEIGIWRLVPDTTSKKKSHSNDWHRHIITKLLPDMGWRMGEKYQNVVQTLLECRLPDGNSEGEADFFEQQYLEKVLRPLSTCSA